MTFEETSEYLCRRRGHDKLIDEVMCFGYSISCSGDEYFGISAHSTPNAKATEKSALLYMSVSLYRIRNTECISMPFRVGGRNKNLSTNLILCSELSSVVYCRVK
jgi:hypothetical protein